MLTRTMGKAAAVLAVMIVIAACGGTSHVRSITLTFVRNAAAQSNDDAVISTDVPGPGLTDDGKQRAQQLAHALGHGGYDGVYASTMARAQQTAAPLAEQLGEQVQVLPELREIDAGWYAGEPKSRADLTYLLAPEDWLHGDRTEAIPGSVTGNEFNDRFTAAVQKIYASGDKLPGNLSPLA